MEALPRALSRTHYQSSRSFHSHHSHHFPTDTVLFDPKLCWLWVLSLMQSSPSSSRSCRTLAAHAKANLFHFEKLDQVCPWISRRFSLRRNMLYFHVSSVVSIFDCRQDLLGGMPHHQHCSLSARCPSVRKRDS